MGDLELWQDDLLTIWTMIWISNKLSIRSTVGNMGNEYIVTVNRPVKISPIGKPYGSVFDNTFPDLRDA